MARRSRSTDKSPLWHGYRRPVWRDGVFWLAVCTSIAGLLVQDAFGHFEATTSGWVILGVEVVFTFAVVFALIGVLASTLRGFGEGWRQAEKATAAPELAVEPGPVARPEPGPAIRPEPVRTSEPESEPEPVVAAPPNAQEPAAPDTDTEPEPKPEPEPVTASAGPGPTPSDRPKAGVEMERQARRLGRAIGAGRRTYKRYDKD